jgi:hypothetical protein
MFDDLGVPEEILVSKSSLVVKRSDIGWLLSSLAGIIKRA